MNGSNRKRLRGIWNKLRSVIPLKSGKFSKEGDLQIALPRWKLVMTNIKASTVHKKKPVCQSYYIGGGGRVRVRRRKISTDQGVPTRKATPCTDHS